MTLYEAIPTGMVKAIVYKHDDLRDRLMFMADLCARYASGDLAEIGAGRGGDTTALAAVARKWGRRVVAVDIQEEDFGIFFNSTLPYRDIVDDYPGTSLDPGMIETIAGRPLCFAYANGQRTHPAVLSDILAVRHAPVVAVRMLDLDFTVRLAAEVTGKVIVQGGEEVYLL